MQQPQVEEFAESDAFEDTTPRYRGVVTLDAAGAVTNAPGRVPASADFQALARETLEDLRYFETFLR